MVRGFSGSRARNRDEVKAIPAGWALLAIFTFTFPLLAFHAAPGISYHDSGEFSLAVHSAGIAHSPGAPTWVILNVLFNYLTFGAEAARSANLFSALCGSLTVAFASVFVFRQFSDRSVATRNFATAITATGILTTGAFLEQSFVAEQYTLLTAFLGAILLVIQTNDRSPMLRNFFVLGLLQGLATGNHPSQVILGPLMLAVVVQKRSEIKWFKSLGIGTLGLMLGLCVYAWLPIRAAAQPLMSWGHPENVENFVASIMRKQWPTRPMNSAPAGFISEWIRSYNITGEMGIVATFLGLTGFALAWRRSVKPVVWIFLAVVPYLTLLLLGHLRQDLMDLVYIRSYGVRDWHIPLYMALSMLGAMGTVWLLDMRDKITEKARTISMATVCLALGASLPFKLTQESFRGDSNPANFVAKTFAVVPQNSNVAMFNDNVANMSIYQHYVNGFRPDVFPVYGMPMNAQDANPGTGWTMDKQREFFNVYMKKSNLNPLNQPTPSDSDIVNRPLLTEFTIDKDPKIAKYMIPRGYLFELRTTEVTDQEIIEGENALRKSHTELYEMPSGSESRLEREAYASAHLRRGWYFFTRNLNEIALDELKIAAAWAPQNPQLLFLLGCTYDNLKQYDKAEETYLSCIQAVPAYAGVRQNLALLYFYAKEFSRAEGLIKKEIELTRNQNPLLKELLVKIQQEAAKNPATFNKP